MEKNATSHKTKMSPMRFIQKRDICVKNTHITLYICTYLYVYILSVHIYAYMYIYL